MPRNALYLLPNALTTAALFSGFYAIFRAIAGDWQLAAVGVIGATILDACDGRVARWTNTESQFGIEYDSLSDAVAFGVAPAVIMYQWGLHEVEKIGFGAAFCYCAATTLRLARFNAQTRGGDRRYFIGIPCPAAAALAVSYVATIDAGGFAVPPLASVAFCLLLAFTMVSGVRFHSFKGLNLKSRISFRSGVLLLTLGAIVLNAMANNLMQGVLVATSLYLLSGYVLALWSFAVRRRAGTCNKSEDGG